MSQRRYPVYEVEWIDSATTPGWRSTTTEFGTSLCRTVGYLLHRDRQMVSLIQSYSEHGAVAEILSIPRAAVRSLRKVE